MKREGEMKKKGYTREVLRGMVRHYEKGLSESDKNVLIWVKENIGNISNCPICSYRDHSCYRRDHYYREEFSKDCPAITGQEVCFTQQWFRIVVSHAHYNTGSGEVRKLLTVRQNYWKDKVRELYPR